MKISEEEFIDCLEVLDLATHEVLREDFNVRIEESKIKFMHIPNTYMVMVEIFKPRLTANKKSLYFDTDDVQFFIENEIGEREPVEVNMGLAF